MALLEVRNLVKCHGDKTVLDGVSFELEEGEAKVIMGPSGCGKSTLLRCLNLLEHIDDGVITFEGAEISDPRVDPRRIEEWHQPLRGGMILKRGREPLVFWKDD